MKSVGAQTDIRNLDKSTKYFVDQFADGHRQITELILHDRESTKIHITEEAESLRKDIVIILNEQTAAKDTQEAISRIIQSLKYSDTNRRRNQVVDSHDGTFEWIFDESIEKPWDCFIKWLRSDSDLYWVNGKPGSGKSTLMKFITCQSRTRDALSSWKPGCIVLSTFIWKSGAEIERSLKGVLSSLLYQLLDGNALSVTKLISLHPEVANKTGLADWSASELKKVLTHLLLQSKEAVCIFIDGLDEIGPENDPYDLLDTIMKLKDLPNVKLCVSSRPERVFQLALGAFPKLRLQDLTASDISIYTTSFLRSQTRSIMRSDYPEHAIGTLARTIVDKANGVFLWVHLVLKSLRTGLTNEDDWSELLRRVELLPSDLDELYNQMWQRLNEDQQLYRKEAAFCFHVVIDGECMPSSSPNLLAMSLGLNSSVVDTILQSRSRVSPFKIAELCHQTASRVGLRSAGLLELRLSSRDAVDIDQRLIELRPDADKLGKQLEELLKIDVAFVHRTARDFLLDTEKGKDLLKYDEISVEDQTIRLMKALLAGAVALSTLPTAGLYMPDLEDFLDILHNLQCFMFNKDKEFKQWEETLHLLRDLHEHNVLFSQQQLNFIYIAASYGFDLFVLQTVLAMEEKAAVPKLFESHLLDCASTWLREHSREPFPWGSEYLPVGRHYAMRRAKRLVDWLVDGGADPNARFYRFGQFLWEPTPLMTFLGNVVNQMRFQSEDKKMLEIEYSWYVGVVTRFLEAGANLDKPGYIFRGDAFEHDMIPPEGLAALSPVFLIEINGAYLIQRILDDFHRKDASLSEHLANSRLEAASKTRHIALAGWCVLESPELPRVNAIVLDLKFTNLVEVAKDDSLDLTKLFEPGWSTWTSDRNPFEKGRFEEILRRGRSLNFKEHMEAVGIFVPESEKADHEPVVPGELSTSRYTSWDIFFELYDGDFPSHNWFKD